MYEYVHIIADMKIHHSKKHYLYIINIILAWLAVKKSLAVSQSYIFVVTDASGGGGGHLDSRIKPKGIYVSVTRLCMSSGTQVIVTC